MQFTYHILFISLSIGGLLHCFPLWLLWIMLLLTLVYRYLSLWFQFLGGIYLGIELLDYVIITRLTFWWMVGFKFLSFLLHFSDFFYWACIIFSIKKTFIFKKKKKEGLWGTFSKDIFTDSKELYMKGYFLFWWVFSCLNSKFKTMATMR